MKILKKIYTLMSSWRLTFWLLALFVLYYLTTALWVGEAFARFIQYLSRNNIVRVLYVIFFFNVVFRVSHSLLKLRRKPFKLFIRLPLMAGIVLFVLSSFMSVNLRQTRWLLLGEGDILRLPWESEVFRVVRIESALKKNLLRMDDSLLFDYEPYITLEDRRGRLFRIGAFPPVKISKTYMHVLDFGIAPGVELLKDGKSLVRGEVALKLIPFGVVDSFAIKGFNYKFLIHVLPNRIIRRAKEVARSYDMTAPRYQVEVIKGDKTVFEGTTDGKIYFDGYSLRLYPPSYWIMLETARDPFYILFIISLGLLTVGVVVYILDYLANLIVR